MARGVNGALEEGVIALDSSKLNSDTLVLPGGATVEIPLLIHCDGKSVINPFPAKDQYSFRIVGDFAPGSDPAIILSNCTVTPLGRMLN